MTDDHMPTCKRLGHVRAYASANGPNAARGSHLVCLDGGALSEGGPAVCDWWPPSAWSGRSSQAELDKARDLPLCQSCIRAVKNPAIT